MFSILMSLFALSATAATFLFYQHSQFITYDERLEKRTFGMNDPSSIYTVPCLLMYIFVNVPRILANSLVWAVSYKLGIILLIPEILLNFVISHKYAWNLQKFDKFPSAFITAFINFLCPCGGPVKNIGKINVLSTILIIIKIILLYPIVFYDVLTQSYNEQPDRFRCWSASDLLEKYQVLNMAETNEFNVSVCELPNILHKDYNITNIPRVCGCFGSLFHHWSIIEEEPHYLLFIYILPITIIALLVISVPFGFMITHFMRRSKVLAFELKVSETKEVWKRKMLRLFSYINCFQSTTKTSAASIDGRNINEDINVYGLEGETLIMDSVELPLVEGEEHCTGTVPCKTESQICEPQHTHEFKKVLFSFLLNVRTMFDEDMQIDKNTDRKYC